LRFRSILLQLGKLQFELFENRAPLGGLAELLVAQLGNRVFELLDQQRTVLRLALPRTRSRFGGKQPGARFEYHVCAAARSVGSESGIGITA
jgi:hypothetical protein